MKTRSECKCICHAPGIRALHFKACCVPDPVEVKWGLAERYVFPVYAIALPETYFNEYGEEVETGRDTYEVWDQACDTVCLCREWIAAENIAFHLNSIFKDKQYE